MTINLEPEKVICSAVVRSFESADEEMRHHALQYEREHQDKKLAALFLHKCGTGKSIIWTSQGWKYCDEEGA